MGVDVPVADGVGGLALTKVRLHHPVVLGSSALGHFVVGDVRNLAEQGYLVLLCLVHRLFQLFVGFLHLGHRLLDGIGLGPLAFLHKGADLGSHLLGFAEVLVQFLLSLTAFLVNGQHLVDGLTGTLEMLLLEALDYTFSFLTDEFEC